MTSTRKWTPRALVVAVASMALWLTPNATAQQQKTVEFRAVFHMTLNIGPDGSGGWLYDTDDLARAMLDGAAVCWDVSDLNPPVIAFHGKQGQERGWLTQITIRDSNGSVVGTFTVGEQHGTMEYAPGQAGMYNFRTEGRIIGGTGLFKGASGSLSQNGPYVFWFDPTDACIKGKYLGAFSASISVPR
jgi:hypothetical protein